MGRLSPEKNYHLLIEAFKGLDTEVKLVLAGGSSYTDEYAATLRKHASNQVVFLDWLAGDALDEVLTNALLFVLPSDIEGMSLALLDAMATGLCVLASDIAENCEVIADAGFTFKRGSVPDLRRTLKFILAHDAVRESCGDRARARVRENYMWEAVTADIENIYFDVMTMRKKSAQSATGIMSAA